MTEDPQFKVCVGDTCFVPYIKKTVNGGLCHRQADNYSVVAKILYSL